MDILFNDLSLHGQFRDAGDFGEAMGHIMKMRQIAKKHQCDVFCHRSLAWSNPVDQLHIKQVISAHFGKDKDQLGGIMAWLDRGPHWDTPENRQHSGDEMMAVDGTPVTNHAAGEAAMRSILGGACGLASLQPSDWTLPQLGVVWHDRGPGLADKKVSVANWLDPAALDDALRDLDGQVLSWSDLEARAVRRFTRLQVSEDCFRGLDSVPFNSGAADMALRLFDTLDRLASELDEKGKRTPEGQRIYQEHFTGKGGKDGQRTWFSDSSQSEKLRQRQKLTFPGPQGKPVFCPWHGKIQHPGGPIRFHFTWPVRVNQPTYVPYIGPKLTKK